MVTLGAGGLQRQQQQCRDSSAASTVLRGSRVRTATATTTAVVAAPDAGAALTQRVPVIGVVVAIWFVSGPLWWSGRTAADRVKI